MTGSASIPIPCAAGIVFDAAGRLLLIRRGRPPAAGSWSVPGGRCLPDEPAPAACVREVAEETGLVVRVERLAGTVQRDAPGGVVFDIADFVCTVVGPTGLTAGDDASEARWVTRSELAALPLVPLLAETLQRWDCLPRI
jgi:8-oxo-dGTP diphosphatase